MRYTALASAVMLSSSSAFAADISYLGENSEWRPVVAIVGDLEEADIEKFATVTRDLEAAVVLFDSYGGSLEAGLEIGTRMRLRGFSSAVPNDRDCHSACALAWLGGVVRHSGEGAAISFHAAYIVQDGVTQESGSGNALVGAYAANLGLRRDTILFLTTASPEEFNLLTPEWADHLRLAVSFQNTDQIASVQAVTEPQSDTVGVFGSPEPTPQTPAALEHVPNISPQPAPQPSPEEAGPSANPEATRIIIHRSAAATDVAVRFFSANMAAGKQAVGGEVRDPDTDLLRNKGGLPLDEYWAAVQKVDPGNTLKPPMQNAALLAEAYTYYMDKGEPYKAEKAARQLLVTQKEAAQTLGTLALNTLETGDLAAGCKLLSDACDRFPAGYDITVTPDDRNGAAYTVKDAEGELLEEGVLDHAQLLELTGEVADGRAFLKQVVEFATRMSAYKGPRSAEEARTMSDEAYVQLRQEGEALQMMLDEGAPQEEIAAQQERLEQIQGRYNAVVQVGTSRFGLSHKDIRASNLFAYESAPPTILVRPVTPPGNTGEPPLMSAEEE